MNIRKTENRVKFESVFMELLLFEHQINSQLHRENLLKPRIGYTGNYYVILETGFLLSCFLKGFI